MFGIQRDKPLELVSFDEAKPLTFCELLCDGVTARNLESFADLLALHSRLQLERPTFRILASLDDLGQAAYTCGHSIDALGLDDDRTEAGHGSSENHGHPDDLDPLIGLSIRRSNLVRIANAVTLENVAGILDWQTPGDANDLLTVNGNPDRALRIAKEKEVIFQFVPVETAPDALAAFPNGYFQSDLSPAHNYTLARHLFANYGLALIAVGSRFLGFRRQNALLAEIAYSLAKDLAALYSGVPPGAANELARLLTGRDWLLFRYTES